MARSFDGVDDVINCGSAAVLDDLALKTIAVWVYLESASAYAELVCKDQASGGGGWRVTRNFGAETIFFQQAFSTSHGRWLAPAFGLNAWKHLAVTYDRGDVLNDPLIYYDGVSQTLTETLTPAGTVISDAAKGLLLGNDELVDANGPLLGRLAGFGLWSVILSAAEVLTLSTGVNPIEVANASLVASLPLCGLDSPEPDRKNTNDGTLTGTAFAENPPLFRGCFRDAGDTLFPKPKLQVPVSRPL